MYQALYRKWRPKVFSEVVGQEHITDTLRRQVAEGHTAHAYLFTGTRGTGKTTCARILAKAVNCLSPVDGEPCGRCEACRAVDAGTTLDITELDAASNNGVDQVRALREEAVYTPAVLKKRVYIIDEVHMLSTPAFNALLKILEEPPEHLMFILATTELHKVPATILSRCQRFSFKRILPRDMERQLLHIAQAESIDLTADGAEILSRMAGGALRDALSLLDQCRVAEGQLTSRAVLDVLGLAGSVQTQQMMRCILDRRTPDALLLLDQLYRSGKDVSALLGELSDLAREMTILKAAPEGGSALLSGLYDTKTLAGLSGNVSMQRLLYLTETLQGARAALPDSFQPRTDVELCLLRLCDESLCGDLTALSARLDRVEELLKKGVPARRERPAAQPAAERPAAPESRQYHAHGHALGDVVQCDGQHHHRRALELALRRLDLPALGVQVRDDVVEQQQKENADPKAEKRRQKREFSHRRRLLDGGDQQAPHRGRDHHARGKARQRALHSVAERLFHEEHARRAERRAEKWDQNAVKCFHVVHLFPRSVSVRAIIFD